MFFLNKLYDQELQLAQVLKKHRVLFHTQILKTNFVLHTKKHVKHIIG